MLTMDRAAANASDVVTSPGRLSPSARRTIFLYLGLLIVLLAFGGPDRKSVV